MTRIFVTGIGTDAGKTVVSAVLVEALQADYWKPIQAGSLDCTDSDTVRALISNTKSKFHAESIRLQAPLSPHAAANLEGRIVRIAGIVPPLTDNTLIVEGAGGVLVPINDDELMVNLIKALRAKTVIVSRHYLGSINHTLLTAEALARREIPVAGIFFVGDENPATERAILNHTQLRILGRIEAEKEITKETVTRYARLFAQSSVANGSFTA